MHPPTHVYIHAAELSALISCLSTSDLAAFQRNAALQKECRTGGQRIGTWTSLPTHHHIHTAHAPHIYSIDFLSGTSFNWSHPGPVPWPGADERAHSPLHYPLSLQGSSRQWSGERGQWKAVTGSTIEKCHIRRDLTVMLCLVVTKTPSLAELLFVISVVVLISLEEALYFLFLSWITWSRFSFFLKIFIFFHSSIIYVGPASKHCHCSHQIIPLKSQLRSCLISRVNPLF